MANAETNMSSKHASDINHAEPDTLRIVLVGETDVGKSSTGNTICGRRVFTTKSSGRYISFSCMKETIDFDGQLLTIVDTPGLFHPSESTEEVEREIAKGVALAAPGPHVLLVVIKPGEVTNEQQERFRVIRRMFGECASKYTMALFTHGDELKHGKSIEDFITQNPDLCAFIRQCGGGYHVFNNRDKDPSQVRELLEKINTMVQRNGGSYYYTADLRQSLSLECVERLAVRMAIGAAVGAAIGAAASTTAMDMYATAPTGDATGGMAAAEATALARRTVEAPFGAATTAALRAVSADAGAVDAAAAGAAMGAVAGGVVGAAAAILGAPAVAAAAILSLAYAAATWWLNMNI